MRKFKHQRPVEQVIKQQIMMKFVSDFHMEADSDMLGLGEMSDKLTHDWGKDLQKSHDFDIPADSEPNSLTDQQLAEERYKQFEDQFMVPEPPHCPVLLTVKSGFIPGEQYQMWMKTILRMIYPV